MNRDDALTAIRPVPTLDSNSDNTPDNAPDNGAALSPAFFQNDCLLPILNLQNASVVTLADSRREHVDIESDLRDLVQDVSLRDRLIGMVIGMLTEDELQYYLANQISLDKWIMDMILQRLEDRLGATLPDDH
jgi:hypothetical protein